MSMQAGEVGGKVQAGCRGGGVMQAGAEVEGRHELVGDSRKKLKGHASTYSANTFNHSSKSEHLTHIHK